MTEKEKLDFVKSIVRYRAKHHLTMEQFAKMANVGRNTIFNIENNVFEPSRMTVEKIKMVLEGENG